MAHWVSVLELIVRLQDGPEFFDQILGANEWHGVRIGEKEFTGRQKARVELMEAPTPEQWQAICADSAVLSAILHVRCTMEEMSSKLHLLRRIA